MTIDEAMEMVKEKLTCMTLEDLSCIEKGCDRDCDNCEHNYGQGTSGEQKEALSIAIKALEEIQQYRSIGTPDECREAVEKQKEIRNKAIDEFAELLKGNLVRKYANGNLTQQYVALQVTDWCNEIAEQLKECSSDDVCEWESAGTSDNWKPSCEPNATFNVFGVAWFNRCPYCGKKIKVVE